MATAPRNLTPVEAPLPYGRHHVDDDDIAAVVAQMRNGSLTQGAAIERFEASICEATGARHAVAVSSGTAALHLACRAAGVGAGDVGIAPDITFLATANALRYCGARPILSDVDAASGCMTPSIARSLVVTGARPRAILPVDYSGHVPDLAGFRSLADEVGATLIEDAAHALGATYEHDGQELRAGSCTHAHMAILSFHPVKHVTSAEGGAITTNDASLARELMELRNHGVTRDRSRMRSDDGPWYYEQHALGFNYRMSDVHAALGASQIQKLPAFVARRRAIAALYRDEIAKAGLLEHLGWLSTPAGGQSAFHLFVIRLARRESESNAGLAARRKELYLHLHARGVLAQVHYIPLHRQPDFEDHSLSSGDFSGADAFYAGCLSLPMFPAMRDDDVRRVVRALREAFR